jgi:uncharacterized membrane protein
MKFLGSIAFILITSVTFTYYLLNNTNFVPVNELGEYNWINILTLILLLSLIIFSVINILIYLILNILGKRKRKEDIMQREGEQTGEERRNLKESRSLKKNFSKREKVITSLKFSLIITIGLLTVFILNFFHILNWMWGISIFLVVLIFIFII